ncbi:MAG: hypothetical protein HC875_39870 [Anaerolineales bacterium]|nr:hypothetical protein [Anaerolineales bacterium]
MKNQTLNYHGLKGIMDYTLFSVRTFPIFSLKNERVIDCYVLETYKQLCSAFFSFRVEGELNFSPTNFKKLVKLNKVL